MIANEYLSKACYVRRSIGVGDSVLQRLYIFGTALIMLVCNVPVHSQNLVILDAKVYPSPHSQPLRNSTIVVRNGKIAAVGTKVALPVDAERIECSGCVVFAGFWNAHVHFTEAKWNDASHQKAAHLESSLEQMLTRSGFTTVADTGSDPLNTVALRSRIESGEVKGPRIYTSGFPLYPPHALPFYLENLPRELKNQLPQPQTPAQAVAAVQQNISSGTDIVKLFTGSIVGPGHIVPMPLSVATSAVAEAHRHHQLVFSHATDLAGVRIAISSGVDVLAHSPEVTQGIDQRLLQDLVVHHVSVIPTLKLFSGDKDTAAIRHAVVRFHQLGGTLLFGTDTGFLSDYGMDEEYRQLSLAGFTADEVLEMLTTAPAERFGVADRTGRIAIGMDADLTILSADPWNGGLTAFTHVEYTIRSGRVLYRTGDERK